MREAMNTPHVGIVRIPFYDDPLCGEHAETGEVQG